MKAAFVAILAVVGSGVVNAQDDGPKFCSECDAISQLGLTPTDFDSAQSVLTKMCASSNLATVAECYRNNEEACGEDAVLINFVPGFCQETEACKACAYTFIDAITAGSESETDVGGLFCTDYAGCVAATGQQCQATDNLLGGFASLNITDQCECLECLGPLTKELQDFTKNMEEFNGEPSQECAGQSVPAVELICKIPQKVEECTTCDGPELSELENATAMIEPICENKCAICQSLAGNQSAQEYLASIMPKDRRLLAMGQGMRERLLQGPGGPTPEQFLCSLQSAFESCNTQFNCGIAKPAEYANCPSGSEVLKTGVALTAAAVILAME